MREFIEITTTYRVCDGLGNDASAIHKAKQNHCDLILLHLTTALPDVTVLVLRSKLPHVKIVGLSTLPVDLADLVSPTIGFDAVLTRQDGLTKLVDTLKALMPKPPRE